MTEKNLQSEDSQAIYKIDLEKRIKEFNAEFIALLAKYKLAISAEPFFARTPEGVYVTLARPSISDDVKPPEPKKEELAQVE